VQTGVGQPLMLRKTSYFDQTCNEFISDWVVMACLKVSNRSITGYHLNTFTIRISRRFSSAREFQMGNFQKYWSQNIGQDCIRTTFDAEENFLFRSNVQWIYLGLSCYGLLGTKADQSIIYGPSSRMELINHKNECFVWLMKDKNCIYNLFIIIRL
jgi:hypothetical protein